MASCHCYSRLVMNICTVSFEVHLHCKPAITPIVISYRYFLKVTIVRRLSDLVKEYDLIVHQLATYPDVNNSIKMEVGIEDCLHIEFEYNKSK